MVTGAAFARLDVGHKTVVRRLLVGNVNACYVQCTNEAWRSPEGSRQQRLRCSRTSCAPLCNQKASTEYYETQRRYNYVTPKSYLELIGFYKFLLDQKRTEVQRQIDRLDVGLSTLRKTAADVAELQVDLTHTMVKVSHFLYPPYAVSTQSYC